VVLEGELVEATGRDVTCNRANFYTGNLESLIGKNEEALVPTCVSDIRDIAVEKESDVEDEIWDTKGE